MSEFEKCGAPAAARVFWPGREPLPMCERHAGMAKGASNALGMYLHVEAVIEDKTCEHAKEVA